MTRRTPMNTTRKQPEEECMVLNEKKIQQVFDALTLQYNRNISTPLDANETKFLNMVSDNLFRLFAQKNIKFDKNRFKEIVQRLYVKTDVMEGGGLSVADLTRLGLLEEEELLSDADEEEQHLTAKEKELYEEIKMDFQYFNNTSALLWQLQQTIPNDNPIH
jgi:hypothetical protein